MSIEPIGVALERLHLLGVAEELAAAPQPAFESTGAGQDEAVMSSDLSAQQVIDPEPKLASGPSLGWTIEAVRQLGTTTDVTTAGHILGIGRTLAFELIKNDAFPVRILRMGKRIAVPIPELLRALGAAPVEPVPDA